MSLIDNARRVQELMVQGQGLKALEEMYHKDIQVYEMATGEHRTGREEQKRAMQDWYNNLHEVHDSGYGAVTSDEENSVTCAELWMDVTFKDGKRQRLEEVAVQKWKDGKIIEEKFYYNLPGK
ncbi:MAG TPA: nuclear transport factor 2 family protein [Flavipsychrobacter sp.]